MRKDNWIIHMTNKLPNSSQLPSSTDYATSFKNLYYHLYSNSSSSRAERIITDLSKLLLIALMNDLPSVRQNTQRFIFEGIRAEETLTPILKEHFPQIIKDGYAFSMDENSLREGLSFIVDLDLRHAPSQLLGDAFQALIGPRIRGEKGQFFTPRTVIRSMINIVEPIAGAKLVDPACGTGGFLYETAIYWNNHNIAAGRLLGLDKDFDLSILAGALLQFVTNNSLVHNTNSLDIKSLEQMPDNESPFGADIVLTNPPFGANIPIRDNSILKQFDLGHVWNYSKHNSNWLISNIVRTAQDPQILFIELCIRLLNPGGKLGIILPEGVFGNSNSGYIWDYIRSKGEIFALIDCPRTTFQPSTDTKTNILFFNKFKSPITSKRTSHTYIAVAIDCGHDRRGRNIKENGESYPDDFTSISSEWPTRDGGLWNKCKITNPYYLVPRYYDKITELLLKKEALPFHGELVSFGKMAKANLINLRKGHEIGSESYGTGQIPFIRTSDISNFEISINPTNAVSREIYNKFKDEQNLKPGDILMVVDGRYRIGQCAILTEYNYKCVVQSHFKIISLSEKAPITPMELLYLLNLKSVQRQIRGLVFIQSTLGSLGKRINEIVIPIPEKNDSWIATIKEFSSIIQERSRLLHKLGQFSSEDSEL